MGRFSPQRRGGRREMRKSQDVRPAYLALLAEFCIRPEIPPAFSASLR